MNRWIILGVILLGIFAKGYAQDEVFHPTLIHLHETTCEEFREHCSEISEKLNQIDGNCSSLCIFIDEILNSKCIQGDTILLIHSAFTTNEIKKLSLFLQVNADVKNFDVNKISSSKPVNNTILKTVFVKDTLDCQNSKIYQINHLHTSMKQFINNCYAIYEDSVGWEETCRHSDPPNEQCLQYCKFFYDLVHHFSYLSPDESTCYVRTCVPYESVLPCIEFVKECLDTDKIDPNKLDEGLKKLFN